MHCGLDEMVIEVDGTVPLRCNDYYSEVVFGNIEDSTIEEVWRQKRYSNVRKKLKTWKIRF